MTKLSLIRRMFADFGLETEAQRRRFNLLAEAQAGESAPDTYTFIILSDNTYVEEHGNHAELAPDSDRDQVLRQHT